MKTLLAAFFVLATYLLTLLFDPEYGGRVFLRNVGQFMLGYAALCNAGLVLLRYVKVPNGILQFCHGFC
jgi:hypothetical protein